MTNNLTPKESLGVRLRRILRDQENVRMKANEEEWLPAWFRVPTPLGTYNPDWAVLVEVDGAERLYFVELYEQKTKP